MAGDRSTLLFPVVRLLSLIDLFTNIAIKCLGTLRNRQQRAENDVETVIHAIKDDNLSLKRKLNEQDEQTKK